MGKDSSEFQGNSRKSWKYVIFKYGNFSVYERNTREHIARMLRLDQRTIYNYQNLAVFLDDYEADIPKYKGIKLSGSSLTAYQAWVLLSICDLIRNGIRRKCIVEDFSVQGDISKKLAKSQFEEFINYEHQRTSGTTGSKYQENERSCNTGTGRALSQLQRGASRKGKTVC